MPNQPATFNKTIRIEASLWNRAGEIAKAQGGSRATVINAFLRWYTGEPGAELPEPAQRKENTVNATTQLSRRLASYLGDTAEGVVLGFLGEQSDSFDVPGLIHAFCAAIAAQLDGTTITLADDVFYAAYPEPDNADELIEAAIEAVDLDELAEKFDRDLL